MVFVAAVIVSLALVGGAAALRLAIGSGTGTIVALVVTGVVLVGVLSLGALVGVDTGGGDTPSADRPASAPETDVVDDDQRAVEHDPVRLWSGLGVAALLLVVAGVLLRGTDWTPIGPDPWEGDGAPPAGGRVGRGPTAAPR